MKRQKDAVSNFIKQCSISMKVLAYLGLFLMSFNAFAKFGSTDNMLFKGIHMDKNITPTDLLGMAPMMTAPEYLKVKDYNKCLKNKQLGTGIGFTKCLPIQKLVECDNNDWNKLLKINMERC